MNKGRRKKIRYIQRMPKTTQFSPRGHPGRPGEVELKVDQFEAIKLADYQGYNQSEGAHAMGISRPTFGRILREGRKIIADAMANGKIIRIRTGNVQVGIRRATIPADKEPSSIMPDPRSEESIRKKILEYPRDSVNPIRITP